MDDEKLPISLDSLLEDHLPAALAYARRIGDPAVLRQESCSDIVMSVFRESLSKRNEFDYQGLPAFRKLLYQRILTKLIDKKRFYQRDKRDVRRVDRLSSADSESIPIAQLHASICSPSEVAIGREDLERFKRCFDRLPPDYQLVIQRARLQGCTHDEIALELDRDRGAVKALLHRALIKLGIMMEREANT